MSDREEGAVAPQFLAVILLSSVLAAGAAMILSQANGAVSRARKADERRANALAIVEEIEAGFLADTSPQIDSADDPGWNLDGTEERGFAIRIIPVSDRINPDFARKNLFDKTGLSGLFLPGASADSLQQYREDEGLQLADEAWVSFFAKEDYEAFFSVWGWANVNLVDEFAARSLATSLTGSKNAGENARQRIRRLLENQTIESPEGMRDFLGADYDALFPAFNAEPSMNVNFVNEEILREILAYPDYGIDNPGSRADSIVAARESGPLDGRDLGAALGVEPDNRILCYFGSVTWFREIRLTDESGTVSAIVARIPPEAGDSGAKPKYERMQLREYK